MRFRPDRAGDFKLPSMPARCGGNPAARAIARRRGAVPAIDPFLMLCFLNLRVKATRWNCW
jgi:hypothetical protein